MSQVVGRYELLRPLGRGGMAEVFHARRRGPGGIEKRLVVKRIRRERSADPRFVKLFVQEARLSMSLAHKNIVPVFDFGRVGDELFLVMEYVDGPDLAAALELGQRAGTPIDAELAAFIAMEACQALDYAHRARDAAGAPRTIVHRDVTTRNVLVSSSGEVKLVDFGVATSETEVGARRVRGTPAYMSPEQARADTVDARSDLFSLGLVLFELSTGTRAYRATHNAELLDQARRADVPAVPAAVPDELAAIVARATAVEPDERYADARAMQLALDSFLVKARARSGGAPPSVRLAAWIEAVWGDREGAESANVDAPSGPVVTFLEDGEEALATLGAGDETMQSMAATMAESLAGESLADESQTEDRNETSGAVASGADDDEAASDDDSDAATRRAGRADAAALDAPTRDVTPRPRGAGRAALVAAAALSLAGLFWWAAAPTGALVAEVAPTDAAPAAPRTTATPDADGQRPTASPVAQPTGLTATSPNVTPDVSADASPDVSADASALRRGAIARPDDDTQTAAQVEGTDARPTADDRARRIRPPTTTRRTVSPGQTAGPSSTGDADEPPAGDGNGGSDRVGVAAIAVRPWAQVTVVGRSETCAETPCRLSLPVGHHTLRLVHTVWDVTKTIVIEIREDEVTRVSEVILQPR